MTKLYLNFFYKFLAALTLILITEDTNYYRRNFEGAEFSGLGSIFNLLDIPSGWIVPIVLIGTIPIFLATAVRPICALRVASFFSFWFVCSFLSNFTHFSQPRVAWILATLIFIGVNPDRELNHQRNRIFFVGLQDLVFAHYALAGIWKVIHFFKMTSLSDVAFSLKNAPWEHMAYVGASGSANPAHIEILKGMAGIVPPIFLVFVLLQFGSWAPILWAKLKIPWAYALIAFHLATAVAMGLTFDYAIAALLILVILLDEFKQREVVS